jgi:hypothetical protein
LLLGKIRFVNERPDFLFAEVVPALVHRDLIEPGGEGRTQVKALERDEDLEKNLLGDILNILPPPQNRAYQSENALLVASNELLEGGLCSTLGQSYEVSFLFGPRSAAERNCDGGGAGCHIFRDVRHVIQVTSKIFR